MGTRRGPLPEDFHPRRSSSLSTSATSFIVPYYADNVSMHPAGVNNSKEPQGKDVDEAPLVRVIVIPQMNFDTPRPNPRDAYLEAVRRDHEQNLTRVCRTLATCFCITFLTVFVLIWLARLTWP